MANEELPKQMLKVALERKLLSAEQIRQIESKLSEEVVARPQHSSYSLAAFLVENGFLSQQEVESLKQDLGKRGSETPAEGFLSTESPTISRAYGSFPETTPLGKDFIPAFGSYQQLEFLGQGGMARVYKAFDPELGRSVALKFVRVNDPELAHRLLMEARAQARIEHEHVCKVYQAGEINGRHYIAMQYISGKNLRRAMLEMTLEQKVQVMKQVAEAIHAAHKAGLIHRDLKPENIMVERTEDGHWIPFVMDFGLAREVEAPGLTLTGIVLGTPSYMSPEQARGEVHRLDWRTDVYSIGATLYELLTGRLPFEGGGSLEILMKIAQEDPLPVRSLNSLIPADLETIVMKCMEKEPQRRYDSAKAVAEDLRRYLEGEPVLAHRSGWKYRTAKKIKKYPVVSSFLTLAALLVLAATAIAIHTWWRLQEQARIANEFAQETGYVEEKLRYVYSAPLHDVRDEEAGIEDRLRQLEVRMKKIGSVAEGPGNYALGRGYMALHQYEHARDHLDLAWNKYKYRLPQVAYALGLTLAVLYQKELGKADWIVNKEEREVQKREIETEYGVAALHYSREGHASTEASEYIDALILFLKKQYADSIRKANIALSRTPWLYEAEKLKGDIYTQMANEHRDRGNIQAAISAYQKAEEAFQGAIQKSASDPLGYKGLGLLELNTMSLVIYHTGDSPSRAFEKGIESCEKGLKVNPRDGELYSLLSSIYRIWAYYVIRSTALDALPSLEKSIEAARQAVRWSPREPSSHYSEGSAYSLRARYEVDKAGLDPRMSLNRAARSFQRAIQMDSRFPVLHELAVVYYYKGLYEKEKGLDPRSSFDDAIRNYQKEIQLNPARAASHSDLSAAHVLKAEYEMRKGLNPTPSLLAGVEALRHAIRINPKYAAAYMNLGYASLLKAEYETDHSQDPKGSVGESIQALQKALEIHPNDCLAYTWLGWSYQVMAHYDVDRSQDPGSFVAASIENLEKATQVNSGEAEPWYRLGDVYRLAGKYRLQEGLNPSDLLRQAGQALQRAEELKPVEISDVYLIQAQVQMIALRWNILRAFRTDSIIKASRETLEKALNANNQSAVAYALLGQVFLFEAERKLRDKRPADQEIGKGLEDVQRALALNSDLPQAYGIRGLLLFLRAQSISNPDQRKEAARQSDESFNMAFKISGNLRNEYLQLLQEARRAVGSY